jgi:hypothetical protein
VRYLLDITSPGCLVPNTIQEVVNNLPTSSSRFLTTLPESFFRITAFCSRLLPSLNILFQKLSVPYKPNLRSVTCTHIPFAQFKEILCAAVIWDQIASCKNLQYCFVGSFAVGLMGNNLVIHELDILVNPSALADNAKMLCNIMDLYHDIFSINLSNRHNIAIRRAKKPFRIAIRLFRTGREGFPEQMIPPPNSFFYHVADRGTYRGQSATRNICTYTEIRLTFTTASFTI